MNHRKKIYLIPLLLFMTVLLLFGCAAPDENGTAAAPADEIDTAVEANGSASETADESAGDSAVEAGDGLFEYTLFFPDTGYMSRDERDGHTGFSRRAHRSAEMPEDVEMFLMEQLLAGPLPDEDALKPIMNESPQILNLDIDDDGTILINLSAEALNGSSDDPVETQAFVDAVVMTMTQMPWLTHSQVLVEGAPWSSGTFVWDMPLGQYEILPSS